MAEVQPNLAASSIIAWLEVEEGDLQGRRIPLVHVDLTFTLDKVAEAGLTLAVGFNPAQSRRNRKSPAHKLISLVDQNLKIRVYMEARGDMLINANGRRTKWTEDKITIFRGKTTGSSYQSFRGQYNHLISASHWLGDLDEGSLLSDVFVRGSIQNTLLKIASDEGEGLIGAERLRGIADDNGLNNDASFELYKKGLRPMLVSLITSGEVSETSSYFDLVTRINKIAPGSAINRAIEGDVQEIHAGNTIALDVLNKINEDSENIIPGDLTIPHAGLVKTKENIVSGVANSIASNAGSGSVLNNLLTLGQSLLFRLVSNVEAVVAAPVMPLWDKTHVWRKLPGSELLSVQGRRAGNERVSSVVLMQQNDTADSNPGFEATGIGGAYVGQEEGTIKLMQAPPWLHTPFFTDSELEAFKNGVPSEEDPSEDLNESRLEVLEIGSRWSQYQWAYSSFRGRSLNITTPFRLDIAPGSMLAVPGFTLKGNAVVEGDDVLYGSVGQMRVIIDSSKPSAVSQFSLTHVRSSSEEEKALTEHPIYETEWFGSPLVKLRDSDLEPQP